MTVIARAALALLLVAAATPRLVQGRAQARDGADHGITVHDAWVRASTTLRTSSSGYCRIENTTDRPVVLVAITAKGVGASELHAMSDHDGQMTMQPVAKLAVPPHQTVDLAPGGTHIMLTGIARPLAAGGTLDITFTFDNGVTRQVRAVVRPLDAMGIR